MHRSSSLKNLIEKLVSEETEEYIVVRPRQGLDSDRFRRVASIIQDGLGGECITTKKGILLQDPHQEQMNANCGLDVIVATDRVSRSIGMPYYAGLSCANCGNSQQVYI